MVWRVSKIDPTTNVAAEAVLKAFEAARGSGRPSVECCRAGVEAVPASGSNRRVHGKAGGFRCPRDACEEPDRGIKPASHGPLPSLSIREYRNLNDRRPTTHPMPKP